MQVICVAGGAQLFQDADVGLCYYESEVDDYIPVACTLQADSAGNMLMTTVSFSLLAVSTASSLFLSLQRSNVAASVST